jgi:hypothetical protein
VSGLRAVHFVEREVLGGDVAAMAGGVLHLARDASPEVLAGVLRDVARWLEGRPTVHAVQDRHLRVVR